MEKSGSFIILKSYYLDFIFIKLIKKKYVGDIYIYKYNNIELKLINPNNLNISNYIKNAYTNYCLLMFYLLISDFGNYLIFSEKVFLSFKYLIIKINNMHPIFKNNKFIMKKEYKYKTNEEILRKISKQASVRILYFIMEFKGNKLYLDKERKKTIKILCENCNIEYDLQENYIEIYIINNEKLDFEKIKYEGYLYFPENDYKIFTKIGKYSLFRSFSF